MPTKDENLEPWSDDLFNRRSDADNLVAYIRSVYRRGTVSGEKKSQVIAVDAEYGIGKTFFLRRFVEQLSVEHCVAYVDAWADDFVDEPLVSVAATLRSAIDVEYSEPDVKSKWRDVASTAGKVAWIGSKGFARQGLKLLISGGAVEGIEAILGDDEEELISDLKGAVEKGLDQADEDAISELNRMRSDNYLDKQLTKYGEVKSSIECLRAALRALALSLQSEGRKLPMIIIIDELDRCRPDYAIRLLEEVKHLFDVPEVCFVLGVNSDQFAKSISHEYGATFDGAKYLDRFIDRTYLLPFPDMEKLVQALYHEVASHDARQLWFAQTKKDENDRELIQPIQWITALLESYEIAPRAVFRFFDRIQTSLAMIDYEVVLMNFLCELVAADMSFVEGKVERDWKYYVPGNYSQGEWLRGDVFFDSMLRIYSLPKIAMERQLNSESNLNALLWEFVGRNGKAGAEAYPEIISRLARFGSTDAQEEAHT